MAVTGQSLGNRRPTVPLARMDERHLPQRDEPIIKRLGDRKSHRFVATNTRILHERVGYIPAFHMEPPELIQGEGCKVLLEISIIRYDFPRWIPPPSSENLSSGEVESPTRCRVQVVIQLLLP